jgi:hypothetical protein
MVQTQTPAAIKARRPGSVLAIVSILFFLGVTALAGGIAMTFGLGGDQVMVPEEWLEDIPLIDSWLLPGLVLGLGFGVGSLITGVAMLKRTRWGWVAPLERVTGRHWSWLATVLIGAGHVAWIALELVFLPAVSWFHPLYGAIGLALLLLPLLPSVEQDLRVD